MIERIKNSALALEEKIAADPEHCFFREPANILEIIDFEVDLELRLPVSYKSFLNYYNGGFISARPVENRYKWSGDIMEAGYADTVIFGLEDLRRIYQEKRSMNWKLFDEYWSIYPIIPFCRTINSELFIFVNLTEEEHECPVFDAFHEEFPSSWGTLYRTFQDFLESYIANDGRINSISYDSPTVAEYLDRLK